jgi:hypothetical protein
MKTLLAKSKTLTSSFIAIPLLGTAIDVAMHLNPKEIGKAFVSGDTKVQ